MRVFLDERPLENPRASLASGLSAGIDAAEAAGRVIVEATLDGVPLTDAQMSAPPGEAADGTLRLSSASRAEVVRQSLDEARSVLAALPSAQQRCAQEIQVGKLTEAFASLSTTLESWQAARDVVEHCSRLGGMAPGSFDESAADDLARALERLKESLSRQDWSGASDVLEFDLGPLADRWHALCGAMQAASGA